jgi:hypothetical protein
VAQLSDEAAVKSAVLLLARSEALRAGYRLTVSVEGDATGGRRYG